MLLIHLNVLSALIDNNLGLHVQLERLLIIRMVNVCHATRFGLIMRMVLDVWVFHSWMKRPYFIRLFLLRKPGTAPILEMFQVRI